MFPSDLASSLLTKATKSPDEEGAFEKSYIPAGRTGKGMSHVVNVDVYGTDMSIEEEMGGTILYMTSRAGGYLNGTILLIDGGRLNVLPGY